MIPRWKEETFASSLVKKSLQKNFLGQVETIFVCDVGDVTILTDAGTGAGTAVSKFLFIVFDTSHGGPQMCQRASSQLS